MARYTVAYDRDETGWWVARLPEVPGCVTQGRTLEEARRRIRGALSLYVRGAARARLVDDVRLPVPVRRAIAHLASAERQVERARALAASARAVAVQVLTGPPLRLSVRDAAEVLGLSHQRIQQLKNRSQGRRGPSRSRRQTRKAARPSGGSAFAAGARA
jgi:predicted RNase H-like HicB family nuclease